MMSDYYKPRWQLFIDYLNKSLTDKTPFNQNDYNKEVFNKVELKFVNQIQSYTTEPKGCLKFYLGLNLSLNNFSFSGDTISIAQSIFEKYKSFLEEK
jgi:hypothetical protein